MIICVYLFVGTYLYYMYWNDVIRSAVHVIYVVYHLCTWEGSDPVCLPKDTNGGCGGLRISNCFYTSCWKSSKYSDPIQKFTIEFMNIQWAVFPGDARAAHIQKPGIQWMSHLAESVPLLIPDFRRNKLRRPKRWNRWLLFKFHLNRTIESS